MSISVVQAVAANSLTPTIAATGAGNCLVVCVMSLQNSAAASISGITLGGAAGNFAQKAAAHESFGSIPTHFADAFAWVDPGCTGGQTAVSVSGSNLDVASGAGGVVVFEVAGLLTTASVTDQTSTGNGNSGTWSSGATPATTQASEIWIGCVATGSGGITGPGSPWTNQTVGGGFALAGYQIVSATGTAAYSGTSTSSGWAAAVITLKAAGAGPSVNSGAFLDFFP